VQIIVPDHNDDMEGPPGASTSTLAGSPDETIDAEPDDRGRYGFHTNV
jgi:hypothetical protein